MSVAQKLGGRKCRYNLATEHADRADSDHRITILERDVPLRNSKPWIAAINRRLDGYRLTLSRCGRLRTHHDRRAGAQSCLREAHRRTRVHFRTVRNHRGDRVSLLNSTDIKRFIPKLNLPPMRESPLRSKIPLGAQEEMTRRE